SLQRERLERIGGDRESKHVGDLMQRNRNEIHCVASGRREGIEMPSAGSCFTFAFRVERNRPAPPAEIGRRTPPGIRLSPCLECVEQNRVRRGGKSAHGPSSQGSSFQVVGTHEDQYLVRGNV